MRPDRNWIETHHEVVCEIERIRRNEEDKISEEIRYEIDCNGSCVWYDIAIEITDKFLDVNKGREWDGDWCDSVIDFTKAWICRESQQSLFHEMVSVSGINVVTCGNCSHIVLHRSVDTELSCPDCKFTSEPCDFPDLYS